MAKKKASKETTKAKPKSKPVDTEPVDVAAVEAPPELSGSDIQRRSIERSGMLATRFAA